MDRDQSNAYEPDTVVADVPWRPPLVRDEDDDEVNMKVMLDDGAWHDELDHTETVCEKFIRGGVWRVPTKNPEPGPMCTGCFFPSEIRRRDAALAIDAADEHAEIEAIDVRDWRDPVQPFSLADEVDRQRKRNERIAAHSKPKKPNGTK